MPSRLWSPFEETRKRRRGGWRQQADAERIQQTAPVTTPSMPRLDARQLPVWADGELSASKMQTIMQDAVSDGLVHPMVTRTSAI
eukprot:7683553-Pyramimonas_sp.AAC.1